MQNVNGVGIDERMLAVTQSILPFANDALRMSMEKGKYVSMRKIFSSGIVWLWIAVFILILDRLAKTWMLHNLTPGDPLYIFPFFNLILVFNTGAAFSFLNSASGWQSI